MGTDVLPTANLLASPPGLSVHTIGGRIRDWTPASFDTPALDTLAQVDVDVAFLGGNGVATARGFTAPDLAGSGVTPAMVTAGERVVVLADSSKRRSNRSSRFAQLIDGDVLGTAEGLGSVAVEEIAAARPEVAIA